MTFLSKFPGIVSVFAALTAFCVFAAAQDLEQDFEDEGLLASLDPDVEERTTGLVHEAYAQPVVFDPEPGIVVTEKPPEPIEELPPEHKPDEENVEWLGGYWGYQTTDEEFTWVSGFYRVIPPTRQWRPGYWNPVDDAFQWISGFWDSAENEEAEYLEEKPPKSLEQGPIGNAPTEKHIWVCGSWVWTGGRYAWQPGHWIVGQPGWVWVPAHYVWTPCGYVFVDGYWDRSPRSRGILFAPVVFRNDCHLRPGFSYCPSVVIEVDGLTDHLFCHGAYHHYCFGDFYDRRCSSLGIRPWYAFHRSRRGYDPCFAYYDNFFRRHDPSWHVKIQRNFQDRRNQHDLRPARTLRAQHDLLRKTLGRNNLGNARTTLALGKTLNQALKSKDFGFNMQKIGLNHRNQLKKQTLDIRNLSKVRLNLESSNPLKELSKRGGPARIGKKLKLNMPKSPVVSKSLSDLTRSKSVPPAIRKSLGRSGLNTRNLRLDRNGKAVNRVQKSLTDQLNRKNGRNLRNRPGITDRLRRNTPKNLGNRNLKNLRISPGKVKNPIRRSTPNQLKLNRGGSKGIKKSLKKVTPNIRGKSLSPIRKSINKRSSSSSRGRTLKTQSIRKQTTPRIKSSSGSSRRRSFDSSRDRSGLKFDSSSFRRSRKD